MMKKNITGRAKKELRIAPPWLVAIGIAGLSFQCFAASIGIETKGVSYYREKYLSDGRLMDVWSAGALSDIRIRHDISKEVTWILEDRFDGVVHFNTFPERTLPLGNAVTTGFEFNKGPFFRSVLIENNVYAGAQPQGGDFLLNGTSMENRALSSAHVEVGHDFTRLALNAEFSYFRLNYNYIDEAGGKNPAVDDDLYSRLIVKFLPLEYLQCGIDALLKNDFNEYGGYEYGNYSLFAGGRSDLKPGKKRIYTDWRISGNYLISEALYRQGRDEGAGLELYVRPLFRLRSRLYLRGTFRMNAYLDAVSKIYSDLALRKSWTNLTAFEITLWSQLGGLFPREGVMLNATLNSGKLTLQPNVELIFNTDDENMMQFQKTVAGLEGSIAFGTRGEIFAGGRYSLYDVPAIPFTSGAAFFLGIRKW